MVGPGVYCILFTNSLAALATFTVLPMLPFLAMRMGANAFQVSMLGPAFFVAQMFCSATVGVVSDRIGRKRVLVAAALFQAFSNFLLSQVSSVRTLLLANFVRGAALSTQAVETAYIMEAAESEDQLGRVLVLQRFALSLGALGGPLLGRFLSHHSFQFLCRGLVSVNCLICLLTLVFLSDGKPATDVTARPSSRVPSADGTPASMSVRSMPTTPRQASVFHSIFRVFGSRSRATLLCVWFASAFSGGVCDGPEMVLFREHFGFQVKQACDFFTVGTLSGIACTSLVHPLIHGVGSFRGFGPYVVCVAGAVGSSLATLCLVAMPGVRWVPYLYAVGMSGIGGSMFSLGFLHMIQKKCNKATLGSFLGVTSALGSAGSTMGPPVGGAAYGLNNFAPPMITAVSYMITAVLIMHLLSEPVAEKARGLAPPNTLPQLTEEEELEMEEEEEILYIPTLLSQPVMLDKTFATRIVVNEIAQDMDPDLMTAYQAYQQQMGDSIRCFSVAGERLVETAVNRMRNEHANDQVKLRRSHTAGVGGMGPDFHVNDDDDSSKRNKQFKYAP